MFPVNHSEVTAFQPGMPRYFFNGSDQPDHEGIELTDDAAANEQACATFG